MQMMARKNPNNFTDDEPPFNFQVNIYTFLNITFERVFFRATQ